MKRARSLVVASLAVVVLSSAVLFCSVVLFVLGGFAGNAHFPADCGVVFGTAVHPIYDEAGDIVSSIAGPGIKRRVSTAAALFNAGKLKKLFLTGGKGEGSLQSEAQVMRTVALERGVPASAIVIEDRATSTVENIEFTRPLTLACHDVVAISDAYHLARIDYLAKSQGWMIETYPAEGYVGEAFTVRSVLREAAALIYLAFVQVLT